MREQVKMEVGRLSEIPDVDMGPTLLGYGRPRAEPRLFEHARDRSGYPIR